MAEYIDGILKGCFNCEQFYGSIRPCIKCRGYNQWRKEGTGILGLLEEWEKEETVKDNSKEDEV